MRKYVECSPLKVVMTSCAHVGWNCFVYHSRALRINSSRRSSYNFRIRSALSYAELMVSLPPRSMSARLRNKIRVRLSNVKASLYVDCSKGDVFMGMTAGGGGG